MTESIRLKPSDGWEPDVGATAGMMRQNANNRASAQASQQTQAQQQAAYGNYEKAYSVCPQGRGYSVK